MAVLVVLNAKKKNLNYSIEKINFRFRIPIENNFRQIAQNPLAAKSRKFNLEAQVIFTHEIKKIPYFIKFQIDIFSGPKNLSNFLLFSRN